MRRKFITPAWRDASLAAAVILAAGVLRMHIEPRMTQELRNERLLPQKLQLTQAERLDQTSYAAALGGLRTMVATTLNVRAYLRFTDCRWDEVARIYDTIVQLAPNTIYYWDTGSWHMAWNAFSATRERTDLPPLRRRELCQAWFARGRGFLEDGLRNNPNSALLWMRLGDLLSDRNKSPDLPAAADAFHRSSLCPKAPETAARNELYILSCIPGRENDALHLARTLYTHRANRTQMLNSITFVVEYRVDPSMPAAARALRIFSSNESALRGLRLYQKRAAEGFPQNGVSEAIHALGLSGAAEH